MVCMVYQLNFPNSYQPFQVNLIRELLPACFGQLTPLIDALKMCQLEKFVITDGVIFREMIQDLKEVSASL